jgi:alpha-1,2-mannosyltransferase
MITDCDETFNYWEPTHYTLYGWGFQTARALRGV